MNQQKRVTMIDVARAAGVSHQTVSRVINQDPKVAPETRQRVLQVIDALNYHPSRVARGLAARQTRTLAVITYDLSYYGPTQIVLNIERAAREAGYDILFINIDPADEPGLSSVANRVRGWAVDGALLIAPVADQHYDDMVEQFDGLPLVQLDVAAGVDVPSVIIDQHLGGYRITEHVIQLGHRAICELRGPLDWHGAVARHAGLEAALAAHGLASVGSVEGNWTAESGYQAVESLLEMGHFTALIAANDQMALGAISALSARGLGVPDDISVVGFDDIPEARFFAPPLTTVRQDFSMVGHSGLEMLIAMIEQPEKGPYRQRVIEPTLVVRESAKSL